jgi:hypothetical protein
MNKAKKTWTKNNVPRGMLLIEIPRKPNKTKLTKITAKVAIIIPVTMVFIS